MNIEDVKQIPIADYLHSLGYSPVKQQGNGMVQITVKGGTRTVFQGEH